MKRPKPLRLLPGLVLLLALGGCALFDISPEPEEYVVQQGDTLYSIAWRNDLDFRELAAWNGIKPPYTIRPGQVLLLEPPEGFVYAPADTPPAPPPPAVSTTPLPSEEDVEVRPADVPQAPPVTVATAPPPSAIKWRWPAEGELLTMESSTGKPGIAIAGRLGQPVRAAAAGRVVYSGSGLQGYGQLVIVKHEDNFLSAYGYNRRLLVRQGDEVHPGQPIAEMGEGPQRRPVLHFEIRRGGQSLDPLQLLPAR
ncbi:MAG TPA: peptidoglycan DD-metalloendopeptidase family protein [Nevskiales bacterium]|nr:peptidoglycan DD-metalloendopeptidase family protein [Nevskiales bacterium]